MKRILIATILVLSLLLVPSMVNSTVAIASDNTSYEFGDFTIEVDISPTQEPKPKPEPKPTPSDGGGGGGIPSYNYEMDLFGEEGTLKVNYYGRVLREIEATSEDGRLTVTIPKKTIALGEDSKRLKDLSITVEETPPPLPEDVRVIVLAYNFSPEGATFDPPITFTWKYDPDALPEGVAEEDLVLAYYDEEAEKWIELDCLVDTINNTITASVGHFTTFAIIGTVIIPKPEPAPVVEPGPIPEPVPPVEVIPTPVPPPEPPAPIVPEPVGMQWWWIVLGVVGFGLAVTGITFWIKRRSTQK